MNGLVLARSLLSLGFFMLSATAAIIHHLWISTGFEVAAIIAAYMAMKAWRG